MEKRHHCQLVANGIVFLKVDFIGFCANLVTKSKISSMDTNCAPLVADLFLFCYDRDFMTSLSDDSQADIIEAFDSTSRYLDDLLIWTILISNEWPSKFIHLSCN